MVVVVVGLQNILVCGFGTVSEHLPLRLDLGLKTNRVFLDRSGLDCDFFIIIIFFMKGQVESIIGKIIYTKRLFSGT